MSRLTKLLIWLSPRKIFIPTQIKKDKAWFGSRYGGFFVHPPSLNEKSVIFSFGVGNDISFDLALIKSKGCKVYTFDPTKGVGRFIQPYLEIYPTLSFTPVGLSGRDCEEWFFPPENSEHISCSVIPNEATKKRAYKVPMKKLSTLMAEQNISSIDLLKLDIEGAEYDVIPDILDEGIKIKQLQVEIHPDLFADGRQKTRRLIRKLNQADYRIFGVSDTCRELSFFYSTMDISSSK